jgi:hypothetical protein
VVYDAISIFDGMFVDDLIYEGYSEICMKGLIGYEPWSVAGAGVLLCVSRPS